MPYVDLEYPQYVRDRQSMFRVDNDNSPVTRPEAEIRHGWMAFGDDTSVYQDYFGRLIDYYRDPTAYVSERFRYDDFVHLRQSFAGQFLPLYLNNFLFVEDVGYHRFHPLMTDLMANLANQGIAERLFGHEALPVTDNMSESDRQLNDSINRRHGQRS